MPRPSRTFADNAPTTRRQRADSAPTARRQRADNAPTARLQRADNAPTAQHSKLTVKQALGLTTTATCESTYDRLIPSLTT